MTVEELQDEILATDAVFPDTTNELAPQIYNLKVPLHKDVEIELSFPILYPDEPPSLIQVVSKDQVKYSDVAYLERKIGEKLKELFIPGCVVIIDLLNELEMFFESYNDRVGEVITKTEKTTVDEVEPGITETVETFVKKDIIDPLKGWSQSDPIVDRGSTFIGYARRVTSVDEAEAYFDLLITDKKIAKSSHNMTAWRIKGQNGVQYQDCDDDGEAASGSRMLHLMTVCKFI